MSLLAVARKGLLPPGVAFGLAGIVASGLAASDPGQITCYVPALEYYGPLVTKITAFPNPTGGATTVRVVATLVGYAEGQRVARVELYPRTESHEEVAGTGSRAMKAVDGEFDSDSEDVYLDLNVSGWTEGTYWLYAVGYNEAGESGMAG